MDTYLVVKSRQENLIQVKPLDTPNLPPADVAWLLLLLKNISTWKADTVTTWLNDCINLSVHADSACDVRLTWCRFSLTFSSSNGFDIFHWSDGGWPASFKTLNECVNSALICSRLTDSVSGYLLLNSAHIDVIDF